MQIKAYLVLYVFLIICNQYDYVNTKAIAGPNVRRARSDEFSFVVSLMRINSEQSRPELNHVCTGSLISKRDVLTAQHCLENEQLLGVVIMLGSVNLRLSTRYYIFWWKTYHDWIEIRHHILEFISNDIAILRLISRVPDRIIPAHITNLSSAIFHGLESEIAGWGISNSGCNPKILETANLNVLTIQECEIMISELHGATVHVDERFICTHASPHILLQPGDSGGPLIHMGKIIGVNRSTMPLPHIRIHPRKVNIHMGIEYYKNFITDVKRNF